jgi:hypothetical protein
MKVKRTKTRLTKAEYVRYLQAMRDHSIHSLLYGLK